MAFTTHLSAGGCRRWVWRCTNAITSPARSRRRSTTSRPKLLAEKPLGDHSVALDRYSRQPLLILKILPIAGRQFFSRCGLGADRRTYTLAAQELQQLGHLVALKTSGLSANALMSTPNAVLVPPDMRFAEIGQHYTVLREPTVERQCVSCFDVNDARRVLLVDHVTNEPKWLASGPAARPMSAVALSWVRSMKFSMRAEVPRKEDRYVQRIEHQCPADQLN
jgi:hypothetical protein